MNALDKKSVAELSSTFFCQQVDIFHHLAIFSQCVAACLAQRSTHYHEDYSMSETEMVLLGVLYTST
jgi:hypothetical protein